MVEEVVLNTEVEKRYAPPSISPGEVQVEVDPELQGELSQIPDKLAFKIGEVADLLGVKAYVLRYWETEFDILKPKKSKHGQRMYERRDRPVALTGYLTLDAIDRHRRGDPVDVT